MWFLKALWNAITSTDDRKARAEEIKARAEETRIINMGYRELNEEYRIKIKEQESRIKELENMKGNLKSQAERETMLDDQQSFHADYIRLLEDHRDALEELYFLRHELNKKQDRG